MLSKLNNKSIEITYFRLQSMQQTLEKLQKTENEQSSKFNKNSHENKYETLEAEGQTIDYVDYILITIYRYLYLNLQSLNNTS